MPAKRNGSKSQAPSSGKAHSKTERSHEENQERAYIAASRRQDRSIEARVQSARMASEIHKKRTGRGFHISEEIVIQEEMYEEEEDDLPRSYRLLNSAMMTNSPNMNNRLQAYLSTQVAMHSMADARKAEVDRLFAAEFPNATHVSQQLQSLYYQPLQVGHSAHTASGTPQPPPVNYSSPQPYDYSRHRSQSIASERTSLNDQFSPPSLTPSPMNSDTPQSNATPVFPPTYPTASAAHFDTPVTTAMPPVSASTFTNELPNEAKNLAAIDANDPLAGAFYGGEGEFAADISSYYDMTGGSFEYFGSPPVIRQDTSRIGTPGGGDGDVWDAWVDTDQWIAKDV